MRRQLRAATAPVEVAWRPDTRLLVIGSGLLVLLTISSALPWFPLCTAALCLAFARRAGASAGQLTLRLANPLAIALVMVLLKSFAGSGWQLSPTGLQDGLLVASRVVGAASVMVLLSYLATVTEIVGALAWLRLPRTFVDIALLAWRYLFVLLDDAAVVYAAQRNRLGYSGMLRGLRSFGALAGLLTVKAFDNSRAITVAMAQRGYDGRLPMALPGRLSAMQTALLGLFAGMAVIAWYAQNHGV